MNVTDFRLLRPQHCESWHYSPKPCPPAVNASIGFESLMGMIFILDMRTDREVEAVQHRMSWMRIDVENRGGLVYATLPIIGPIETGTYFHVTCGRQVAPHRAERVSGVTYLNELGLADLIRDSDRTFSNRPEIVATRKYREYTLASAFSLMVGFGSSAAGSIAKVIHGPSGGKPYEREDEELDAVDELL